MFTMCFGFTAFSQCNGRFTTLGLQQVFLWTCAVTDKRLSNLQTGFVPFSLCHLGWASYSWAMAWRKLLGTRPTHPWDDACISHPGVWFVNSALRRLRDTYSWRVLQFYRLGNLLIGWKLGVRIHTTATIVQWYNRMLQCAGFTPNESKKLWWVSITPVFRYMSASVVQLLVMLQWCGFNVWWCFVWFANGSVCAYHATRSCAPPPLRNSKHSVGFSVSVSKIYVWFSRRICLRHFWCSRQSRRRRVAMDFGKRICDLIPVSMLSICIDHTKRMRWTTLCGRHVVLCGTCCCSCVLVK